VFYILQIHTDFVHNCQVCHPGDLRHVAPPSVDDTITEEEEEDDPDGISLR